MAKRIPASIEDELDQMSGGAVKESEDISSELDSAGYSAPDAREKPSKIATLGTQKEVADFIKDMGIFFGQGALHGTGEELLAAGKTRSFSSPEYLAERDLLRGELQQKRENYPYLSPLVEGAGATASSAILPILRGSPVIKELISSGIQGAGESLEMEDVPRDAAKSVAISGAMQGGGKLLKEAAFDDPTKILTRSMGVRSKDMKSTPNSKIVKAVKKLDSAGFFKQGEVGILPGTQKFTRSAKNLTGLFKPQTLDSLKERIQKNVSVLKDRNNNLIKGKMVPSIELRRGLYEGIQGFTLDVEGFNVEARYDLAKKMEEIILKDLKYKTKWKEGKPIPAEDIEAAKRSLDKFIGSDAFKKQADDLGINAESMMEFRTKLDDILDVSKVGGDEYRKNNDLMSALLSVDEVINSKEARDYLDDGSGLVDMRSLPTKLLEAISPTSVDIVRSDISKAAGTPMGKFVGETLRRLPVEKFAERKGNYPVFEEQVENQPNYDFTKVRPAFDFGGKRTPQGYTDVNPVAIAKMKLPRSSAEWIKNKDLVVQKMASLQVEPDLIDATVEALNNDHSKVEGIAKTISAMYPEILEASKYNVFNGIIVDPNERAKAADDTSKRDDLGSIQKAKIIRELNKSGRWLDE